MEEIAKKNVEFMDSNDPKSLRSAMQRSREKGRPEVYGFYNQYTGEFQEFVDAVEYEKNMDEPRYRELRDEFGIVICESENGLIFPEATHTNIEDSEEALLNVPKSFLLYELRVNNDRVD